MKKLMTILTTAALAVTIVGCNKQDNVKLASSKIKVDENTPSWKTDKKTANLDWYINFDWFAQTWGNDVATKFITEDTHVNIKYQNGTDEKLNTMIASGDLPDIITLDGNDPLIKDADKFAMPLDELSKKYDPYFLKTAAKPETVKFFTRDDGHIYGYPNFSTTTSDYKKGGVYSNEAFMVRKDLYEKIGKPDMSTPEGFTAALEAVQKLNLKDNQGKPIVPFGTQDFTGPNSKIITDMFADFLGVPVVTKDGKFYDRYNDKDFKKWLKVFVSARQNGLTDKDMLTMTADDKNTRLTNGTYFAYFNPNIIGDTEPLTVWTNEHPDKEYIAVNGPSSTVGRKASLPGVGIEGWTQTFISKDCKNPQKAMEFVTYMASKYGNTVMNYGREGQTYTMVNGNPVLNKDLLDMKQKDPAGFETKVGLTTHLWLQDSALLSRQMGIAQFPKTLQQPKQWTVDYVAPRFELAGVDIYLSKPSARNIEKINQKWAETVAKSFDAKKNSDVDKAMAEFMNYRKDNGYDKVIEERNKQIKSTIKKLK